MFHEDRKNIFLLLKYKDNVTIFVEFLSLKLEKKFS